MGDHRPDTGGRGQPSTSGTGTAAADLLAEGMSGLARDLDEQDDPDAMLAAIVAAAVAMIPGVEEGSISVVRARRQVTSQAATGELPVQVDAIQEETQQGPCPDAAYEQQTVRLDDLATEGWCRCSPNEPAQPARPACCPCSGYVEGDNLGALNLYARTPDAFTDESEQVGLLFAAHAAIAYAGVRKETHLPRPWSDET